MQKNWDAKSVKEKLSFNINRLYRYIKQIETSGINHPASDREISILIGRIKANTFLSDDAYLISADHLLDKLDEMKSILPGNIDEAKNREHFKLGWKCEIEILKTLANKG